MRWILPLCLLLSAGCAQPSIDEPSLTEEALFGPTSMRIHPIFSQIEDWNSDGKPDGIEALLEFSDQFGDPTKAAGSVMFELFSYRKADPEPRGQRLLNPWIGSIATRREQEARWNRTSRTYSFQLAYPQIESTRSYVLTAVFRSSTGGRFFDRIILEAQEDEGAITPTTRPVIPTPAP